MSSHKFSRVISLCYNGTNWISRVWISSTWTDSSPVRHSQIPPDSLQPLFPWQEAKLAGINTTHKLKHAHMHMHAHEPNVEAEQHFGASNTNTPKQFILTAQIPSKQTNSLNQPNSKRLSRTWRRLEVEISEVFANMTQNVLKFIRQHDWNPKLSFTKTVWRKKQGGKGYTHTHTHTLTENQLFSKFKTFVFTCLCPFYAAV